MRRLASSLVVLLMLSVFALGALTLAPGNTVAGDIFHTTPGPNAPAQGNPNPRIFPPQSRPYGDSYTDWATRWFQWIISIPADQSPFLDPDGRFCQVDQSGPVFFLGATFGGDAVRSCTISAGKSVMVSPGGFVCLLHFDAETEEGLRACVEQGLSTVTRLNADVDGAAVQNLDSYRVETPLIKFTLPESNVLGLPSGEYQAVVGGWFLILPPLPPGEHVIHVHDEFAGLVANVTYNLTVAPQK